VYIWSTSHLYCVVVFLSLLLFVLFILPQLFLESSHAFSLARVLLHFKIYLLILPITPQARARCDRGRLGTRRAGDRRRRLGSAVCRRWYGKERKSSGSVDRDSMYSLHGPSVFVRCNGHFCFYIVFSLLFCNKLSLSRRFPLSDAWYTIVYISALVVLIWCVCSEAFAHAATSRAVPARRNSVTSASSSLASPASSLSASFNDDSLTATAAAAVGLNARHVNRNGHSQSQDENRMLSMV
jgi:hypothetical protein